VKVSSTFPISEQFLNVECICRAAFKETMRLRSPGVAISREMPNDVKLKNGVILKKGCVVDLMLWYTHQDPRYWDEPEKFYPERFAGHSDDQGPSGHPFAYIPFSAGPRVCIGKRYAMLELTVLLSTLISHFDIQGGISTVLMDTTLLNQNMLLKKVLQALGVLV